MPSAAILPAFLTIPRRSNQSLSSCRALTGGDLFRPLSLSSYFAPAVDLPSTGIIRMGGGPRTFPGGVSKWQWKRMQAKKAKQLLKARLCRERQLYEMRKRAELKAAISELERPWEVVERAPVLFSVSADEQVKVLADRFQRPTGFDMWSERDGPQLFRSPDNLPSARFFPKGVVHSVKPYSAVADEIPDGGGGSDEGGVAMRYNDWIARGAGGIATGRRVRRADSKLPEKVTPDSKKSVDGDTGKSRGFNSELLLSESRKEEKEWHDQNHGLNTEEDEMAGECDWDNGRSRVPHLSDSELELDDLRMEGHKRAGGFRRRGGQEGRGWNQNTHQSNSALSVSGSRMGGNGMANDFGSRGSNQRFYGSDSEIVVSSSRMQGNKFSGGFNRRGGRVGRGGYGGRNGNRGFYPSNSMLQNQVSHITNPEIRVGGSRMNGHEMAGGFSRHDGRGGRSESRISYWSYSDSAVDDSRFNRHMAGNFSRHRDHGRNRDSRGSNSNRPVADKKMDAGDIAGSFAGRGGRGGRAGSGYRMSNRSYSDSAVDDSRFNQHMAGNFSRYRDHGRSWDSHGSNSDRPIVDRKMDAGYIAGSFTGRGGRGGRSGNRDSYETFSDHSSRVKDNGFGRRGGRGRFQGSYGADSELRDAGSSKATEMAGGFGRPGGGWGYKNAGSFSLRPTTQLKLAGGGRGSRGRKWREEE